MDPCMYVYILGHRIQPIIPSFNTDFPGKKMCQVIFRAHAQGSIFYIPPPPGGGEIWPKGLWGERNEN